MKNNQGKGLLALLGLGAGLFAWWKYKNMTPAEKEKLKTKIDDTGKKIKDTVQDLTENLENKVNKTAKSGKEEWQEISHN